MQLAQLFPLSGARRIRHARSDGGYADPHASEASLQLAGAIPPPGGWPPLPDGLKAARNEEAHAGTSPLVHITTHSVV